MSVFSKPTHRFHLHPTTAGKGKRLAIYIHHDDTVREYAYDRNSHIGCLDRGLDEAPKRGWTVVSMKKDWKTIFKTARNRHYK